ncbi:MAG TPA: hypothetical protein DCZ94_18320 [Lentisphaeria bacterium]|nr:MAG: hypothetical protein A2X48_22865 [Lentisphaerae bacterium GWF2_49_21]HBC88902.1 hypothetical protein [Lentisphaeria bacterium]
MKILALVAVLTLYTFETFAEESAPPKVAVWNPEKGTNESRFSIDLKAIDKAAGWLKESGCKAELLTAEQINDPKIFNADSFDALMIQGDAFPKINIQAYKTFAEKGGVLVSLGAKIPFLIAAAKEPDGFWTMSPKTPAFAWQNVEVLKLYNMKYSYNEAMHDKGVDHRSTDLLRKYLHDAKEIKGNIRGWWIIPINENADSGVYPLIRSKRLDGLDTTPQIFIAKNGSKNAIFCLNEWFTDGSNPKHWNSSKELVVAFAKIAKDLKDRKIDLSKETPIEISDKTPAPTPMRSMMPSGSVEPEGAKPVARWGMFDGSCAELGDPIKEGQSKAIPLNSSPKDFPYSLEPKASVKLAIPKLPEDSPCFLRARFCFVDPGTGLKAKLGDAVLIDELFVCMDASGPGNFSDYASKQPIDTNRILYIPSTAKQATELEISNPGTASIYFDAVQIETRPKPAPERWIGLNGGILWGGTLEELRKLPDMTKGDTRNSLTEGGGKNWSTMRCTIRSQYAGAPNDPDRWKVIDFIIDRALTICPRLDLLFEGTAEWDAISPQRYAEGKKAGRPHTSVPDTAKYLEIVEHVIKKYGDRINNYEVWNETNITQFWRGTPEEYASFFIAVSRKIKELSPKATVIMGGMAGYRAPFINTMHDSDAFKHADLCGFHPYAGKSSGWDVPYGMIQSDLYSKGDGIEIYCNESGFVWKAGEWFQPPPDYTQEVQAEQLDVAIGRLLSSGLAKLSVFHAGGDEHLYGLIDEKGKPRLAYKVMEDYFELGKPGSRRLDVQMVSSDGTSLKGIYCAASNCEKDGSASVVLNPSQSQNKSGNLRLCIPFTGNGHWKLEAKDANGAVPLKAALKGNGKDRFYEVEIKVAARTLIKASQEP